MRKERITLARIGCIISNTRRYNVPLVCNDITFRTTLSLYKNPVIKIYYIQDGRAYARHVYLRNCPDNMMFKTFSYDEFAKRFYIKGNRFYFYK